ncbi:MAG: type I-E CRISPR-associated protein Cse2/CasB [Micropruina sp.]|nr:type I-E CRISPR-associated protein Cse2/CasB [Micropruina sp.]
MSVPAPRTVGTVLTDDVRARVNTLQESSLNRRGPAAQANAQADLAKLRGADPADPATHPECWSIVQGDTPPELLPKSGDDPSAAERARHCALVTYARHQQAQTLPMHASGVGFARAVRAVGVKRAALGEEFDPGVRRRFDQLLLSPTWTGRSEHLNALVRLMRTESIAFDYGQLANDLRGLSHPEDARRVRVRWARDLYSRVAAETGQPNQNESTKPNEGELA